MVNGCVVFHSCYWCLAELFKNKVHACLRIIIYISVVQKHFNWNNASCCILHKDRGRSILEGAHIHIFRFINRENNQFQGVCIPSNE